VITLAKEILDDATVVRCGGRLVAGSTDALHAEIKSLLVPGSRVVLDFSGLTQMDSSGLGSVVALYVSAKSAGAGLELTNLAPKIRMLFSMTNLLTLFQSVGDGTIRIP
jgi:anti-anti-sigma factor